MLTGHCTIFKGKLPSHTVDPAIMATENWFQSDSIVLLFPSWTIMHCHPHYTLWTNNTSPLHTVNNNTFTSPLHIVNQQHIHITITHCEPITQSQNQHTLWTNNTSTSPLVITHRVSDNTIATPNCESTTHSQDHYTQSQWQHSHNTKLWINNTFTAPLHTESMTSQPQHQHTLWINNTFTSTLIIENQQHIHSNLLWEKAFFLYFSM